MTDKETILILDDTAEIAELIGELAAQAGFAPTVTTDIESFNRELERNAPPVIVLDLQMPGTDGIEVIRQLSSIGCQSRILLVTGMDPRTVDSAKRFGERLGLNMLGAVQKPFVPEVLIDMLRRARSLTGQLTSEDFDAALHEATLIIQYQPVVRRLRRRSWHAESVEALPRWKHPVFGMIAPGQFLPLLGSDRSTLMQRLTDFVLQRGAEQLRTWQSIGLHLGLRVNVPAGLISDTDFPDRLESLLAEFNADPELLTLELSDALPLAQSSDGMEILTRLRLKGIRLSLDDFGGRENSVQALYALPISEVKIDRNITADLAKERGAEVVVSGLLSIFKQLEIECCAEGVESSDQFRLLDDMKCDLAQGFHIGTPLPAADLPKALESWTADSDKRVVGAD